MRFIVCAVAAAGLLTACASNNDEMAADTGTASSVSATTSDSASTMPADTGATTGATTSTPAPDTRTGERG
ncbi:hypothetical protein [Phenylobacterium sp.]|uniref:hypothetical protein n=1 Tax=Phenylobacterium sp. TaxID=1871053 RepID=UPI002F92ED94